jgi:hypothetical protein
MEIKIDLYYGIKHSDKLTRKGIQKNIDCVQRVINRKPLSTDFISLIDTKSILEAIQSKIPE